MKLENRTSAAFPSTDCATFAYDGLTKQEYTCIKLGIPETGDSELDDLIRKSERKRLSGLAMQGLLSANAMYNGKTDERPLLCQDAIAHADELLKQLEK